MTHRLSVWGGLTPASASAWVIFISAGLNALFFVYRYTDPLIVHDGWYTLEVFVRPALEGSLELGDFFVRRAGIDHQQPLHKLIFLMQLFWFDLDYRPGAIIGVLSAGGCSLIIYRVLQWRDSGSLPASLWALCWATSTVILFSLNDSGSWRWPLAALYYLPNLLIFLFFALAWKALESGKIFGLGLMSVCTGVVADGSAALAAIALFLVMAVCWSHGFRRDRIIGVGLSSIGVVLLTLFIAEWFGPVIGGLPSNLHPWSSLMEVFFADGWWKWWILPLANSVVSTMQFNARLGTDMLSFQIALGVFLAIAHLGFWRKFLRSEMNGGTFFGACVMLLFYGYVAGIILGRVSFEGSGYLNQPRYVLMYQFNLIALVIMYAATYKKPKRLLQRISHVSIAALFFIVILLQVPFSIQVWRTAPQLSAYYHRVAQQILAMDEKPEITPTDCSPILPPCEYTPDRRRQSIGLLKQHKLNVFSRKFRAAHGLNP